MKTITIVAILTIAVGTSGLYVDEADAGGTTTCVAHTALPCQFECFVESGFRIRIDVQNLGVGAAHGEASCGGATAACTTGNLPTSSCTDTDVHESDGVGTCFVSGIGTAVCSDTNL